MILPLEDRWGLLSILEYEHGAKKALLALLEEGELEFRVIEEPRRRAFIEEEAAVYASHGFRQAKEFFRHAEASSWLAKPLLLYYGMLGVVKSGLVMRFPDYFRNPENLLHGIGSGDRAKTTVDFQREGVEIREEGVYPLARLALDLRPLPPRTTMTLHDLLTRLPEVDATYRFVFRRQGDPPNCIKIWGNVIYRDPADGRARMGFDLAPGVYDSIRPRLPDEIVANADVTELRDGGAPRIIFRSRRTWDSEFEARAEIPHSITSTLDQNFALILPVVLNDQSFQLTELELMYLAIFYFSNLARYQPHLWVGLHAGADDLAVLLCQDLMRSCENKFLGLVQQELQYAYLLPFRP